MKKKVKRRDTVSMGLAAHAHMSHMSHVLLSGDEQNLQKRILFQATAMALYRCKRVMAGFPPAHVTDEDRNLLESLRLTLFDCVGPVAVLFLDAMEDVLQDRAPAGPGDIEVIRKAMMVSGLPEEEALDVDGRLQVMLDGIMEAVEGELMAGGGGDGGDVGDPLLFEREE